MRILVNEFCGHPFGMELSREFAKRGHAVYHAYFADNKSTPKGSESLSDHLPNLITGGLHISRPFEKHGLLSRRAADIEYGQKVAIEVKKFKPDVVISANMPLDGQKILLRAAKQESAKFVFWLQDIYSTAVRFVLGRKAPVLAGMVAWYYEQVEKKLLRDSDAIVCIAPAFASHLAEWRIDGPSVITIPNWAPLHEIVPMPKDNLWAHENGVADKFCFIYSGTLGMKHRPELLLDLARRFEKTGNVRILVIAGGAGADWLSARVHQVSGDVLRVLPFQPYERVPEALGAADVLITLLDSEAGAFAVPSKTLAYLCAGRPIIIAAPEANEAARIVNRANAGLVISPDSPEQLITAAEKLLNDPQFRAQLGTSARQYAERAFAIESVADQFLAVFQDIQTSTPVAKVQPAQA